MTLTRFLSRARIYRGARPRARVQASRALWAMDGPPEERHIHRR